MVVINNNTLKDLFYTNAIYELHKAEEKILLFEKKYNNSFDEFERNIKGSKEEHFEQWDDYMEWKAYSKSVIDLKTEIEDIKNGNYKIS